MPFPNPLLRHPRRGTSGNILSRSYALLLSFQPPVAPLRPLPRVHGLLCRTPVPKIFQNDSSLQGCAAIPELLQRNRRKPERQEVPSSIWAIRGCDALRRGSCAVGHETSETSGETYKTPSSRQ